MKFLPLIALIFLVISPPTLFARFHRVENFVNKIFKGERRQSGFGKFVGAGDLDVSISQQKQPIFGPMKLKLMRSGNSNRKHYRKAPQISPSGPTDGWYYGSAEKEPVRPTGAKWTRSSNNLLKRLSRSGWKF